MTWSRWRAQVGTDSALLMQPWDSDNSGTLDFREFVEGAMRIRKSEESQLLLMLQHDLHGYSRTLLDQLSRLECWDRWVHLA